MEAIEKAEPFFIFCVRSNAEKVTSSVILLQHPYYECNPTCLTVIHSSSLGENVLFLQKEMLFDDELVLQQIKYHGIKQMVHIQKSGYSAKYTFKVGIHELRGVCTYLFVFLHMV